MTARARKKDQMREGITTDRLDLTDLLEISDLLLRTGSFRFHVAGWSMSPALRRGDRLTVEPVSWEQLRVGDLLLYHHRGRLVCHRLVAFDGTGPAQRIITKGDATAEYDPPLQPDQVLGKVVHVRRSGLWDESLGRRIDRLWERLSHRAAGCLGVLQSHRFYRRVMGTLCSRCFAFYVGIPSGRRWYQYQRIPTGATSTVPEGCQSFRLLAKVAGRCVGNLHVEARADGYWLEALYVRVPYRGLGLASQLLNLACQVAVRSHARALLAPAEPGNQIMHRLLEQMGFQPLPAPRPSEVSVLVRELRTRSLDGGNEPQLRDALTHAGKVGGVANVPGSRAVGGPAHLRP